MSSFYNVTTKIKPKWYQLRWQLSNLILKIARLVYPPNPDVWAFMVQCQMDMMVTGKAITRVDPMEYNK